MYQSTHFTRRIAIILIVAASMLGLGSVAPVHAQEDCYPDGCTEPTNPIGLPNTSLGCELSASSGEPGATVSVVVTDVPEDSSVRILFDGSEVARSAPEGESDDGPSFAQGAPRQESFSDVSLTFVVPDVPPGTYSVVAVGADFTIACEDSEGNDDFGVLAAGASQGSGSGSGRDGLAFSGLEIFGMVLLAGAFLLVGWALVNRSRLRRTGR